MLDFIYQLKKNKMNIGFTGTYCKTTEVYMRKPKPYLERNKDIVDETGLLIATPKGEEIVRSGTWSTIRYARKNHKKIIIIMPNGNLRFE